MKMTRCSRDSSSGFKIFNESLLRLLLLPRLLLLSLWLLLLPLWLLLLPLWLLLLPRLLLLPLSLWLPFVKPFTPPLQATMG
jgi:hypothetical protein